MDTITSSSAVPVTEIEKLKLYLLSEYNTCTLQITRKQKEIIEYSKEEDFDKIAEANLAAFGFKADKLVLERLFEEFPWLKK